MKKTAEEITNLNKEQQQAFNRLKKAYKDCERLKVFFVNRYGNLYAYNGSLISGFGDSTFHADGVSEIKVSDVSDGDYLSIANEWADDDGDHYLGLTERGHDLYFNSNK